MKNQMAGIFLVVASAASFPVLAAAGGSPSNVLVKSALLPLAVKTSVMAESNSFFISSWLDHPLNESQKKITQRDLICIYICNKDPSEGGTYCNCDAYPLDQ